MYKDQEGNIWYKVGLHIHTTLSDGRVTPEEAAMIYREAGFDAIAVTDHWKYYEEGELAGLKILSGCEYNMGAADTAVDVMHIVGVGMKQDPGLIKGGCNHQEIIDGINDAGGLAVLAHPAWSLNTPADVKHLKGFGATEIYNTVSDVGQSNRPYSGYFVDILANEGIAYPLLATDDTHYYDGTDETKSYIMVKASELTTEAILEAIRKQDFYATQGPYLQVDREGERILASCSECVQITFMTNSSWAKDRTVRGSGLTHAEYTLKEWDKWVRVEVLDAEGRYAWSNVIML